MNKRFKSYVELLEPLFQQLMRTPAARVASLPADMPRAGVYLFSEGSRHLYVGRTNRMRARLQEHCRAGSTHNSAPFAFTLAREATGRSAATYAAEGSRQSLERDPEFRTAFERAKARVRRMDIRFVQEGDPTRQALLELYAAIALGTRYNDFDTH